jgi:VanZ family protein
MIKHLSIHTLFITLITTIVVSFLLFFDFGKPTSRLIAGILDFGHIPLFGLIALGILWFLNRGKRPIRGKSQFITAGVITFFLGALTEFIQLLTPSRDFEVGDIIFDAIGAAVFLSIAYPFPRDIHTKTKSLMRAGALSLLMIASFPMLSAAIDSWNMEKSFPVLGSFETSFEMNRWSSKESRIERTRTHATAGDYSLKMILLPGVYPGISLDYLQNDWRGYTSMSFDVFNEGNSPLDITVRINDQKHNNEFIDRFNKGFRLQPGKNHVIISLDEVKKAPRVRKMDMADITNICIFAYNLKTPRTVYFDNFRLENRG